jgi:hypothetical protein
MAMKTNRILAVTLAAALPAAGRAAEGTLSGPYTHENLQVFLIHGDAALEAKRYADLATAMERGWVIVEETGRVGDLSVENTARDVTVFLQAGDILKGGRQDRTVRYDLLLPPRSGRVPLAAFCVEHGRWQRRGGEDAGAFSASPDMLPSKSLRLSAKSAGDQGAVWAGVADQQEQLNRAASEIAGRRVDVRDGASASSLQLSLENKDLERLIREYLADVEDAPRRRGDIIGFVFAINGEINSADVYANRSLFRALWPKLIRAAAIEAIGERSRRRVGGFDADRDLPAFFARAIHGRMERTTIWKSTQMRTYVTDTTVLYETLDMDEGGTWLHKNFVQKDDHDIVVPLDARQDPAR